MTVYGLTGKTGAGKSTVAKMLSKKGFYVIDGDIAARSVTEPFSPVLERLAQRFGRDIIFPDGSLNRKKLASRAFADKDSTDALNMITHAAIDKVIRQHMEKADAEGFEKCLIDAAALLESPSKGLCEKIIVVTAPEDIRIQRIIKRDALTLQEAQRRINAQKSDEYYFSAADIIIRNYPPYLLEEEIGKVW